MRSIPATCEKRYLWNLREHNIPASTLMIATIISLLVDGVRKELSALRKAVLVAMTGLDKLRILCIGLLSPETTRMKRRTNAGHVVMVPFLGRGETSCISLVYYVFRYCWRYGRQTKEAMVIPVCICTAFDSDIPRREVLIS